MAWLFGILVAILLAVGYDWTLRKAFGLFDLKCWMKKKIEESNK